MPANSRIKKFEKADCRTKSSSSVTCTPGKGKKRLAKIQQQQLESWVIGTVNWYDQQKDFGFITSNNGGSDVYVNNKQLRGILSLSKGDKVKFVLRSGDRPWAANVMKIASVSR